MWWSRIADEIGVMKNGKLLEFGSAEQIFYSAQNDYTKELIDSVRKLETSARAARGSRVTDRKLMEIRGVSKIYPARSTFMGKTNPPFKALDNVSLDKMYEGENLGIVGESGSGKTTLGNCVIRVLSCSGGEVLFRMADGRVTDLAKAHTHELRQVHREIRMVFQDPFASLNPRMTIGQIVGEPLLVAGTHKGDALRQRTEELLAMVGIPGDAMERYPHAFSGGQRQRIGIARALALNPQIIADESTSALDVTLRSQVLDLLLDLQDKLNLSFIFVSHDIGVIRYFCDRVAVMYKGQVVEHGPAEKICSNPDHPYTKALISAVPGTHPHGRSGSSTAIAIRVRKTASSSAATKPVRQTKKATCGWLFLFFRESGEPRPVSVHGRCLWQGASSDVLRQAVSLGQSRCGSALDMKKPGPAGLGGGGRDPVQPSFSRVTRSTSSSEVTPARTR